MNRPWVFLYYRIKKNKYYEKRKKGFFLYIFSTEKKIYIKKWLALDIFFTCVKNKRHLLDKFIRKTRDCKTG